MTPSGIATIYTPRRFYIFMRRTTIPNSSFEQSFHPQSKGGTPNELTLNPSSKNAQPIRLSVFLYDLEEEEFQIIGFRHCHKDRMIGSLLAELDLPERDAGIARCFLHHLHEELLTHKM